MPVQELGRIPIFATLAVSLLVLSPHARSAAQRPSELQAASNAFARGQQAQLAGQYDRAAELFELAYDAVPSAAAMRAAIGNHRAAGALARSATLAVEALERYSEDGRTVGLAREVIAEASHELGAIQVACEPACTVTTDGGVVDRTERDTRRFFVEPGRVELSIVWDASRALERAITIERGDRRQYSFVAPAATHAVVRAHLSVAPLATATDPSTDAPSPGLSPALFVTGLVLVAVGVVFTVWSTVDLFDAQHAYERNPTRAGYDDGVGRELRNDVLIASTAGVAAATLVLGLFADWDESGPGRPAISLGGSPRGGLALLGTSR